MNATKTERGQNVYDFDCPSCRRRVELHVGRPAYTVQLVQPEPATAVDQTMSDTANDTNDTSNTSKIRDVLIVSVGKYTRSDLTPMQIARSNLPNGWAIERELPRIDLNLRFSIVKEDDQP